MLYPSSTPAPQARNSSEDRRSQIDRRHLGGGVGEGMCSTRDVRAGRSQGAGGLWAGGWGGSWTGWAEAERHPESGTKPEPQARVAPGEHDEQKHVFLGSCREREQESNLGPRTDVSAPDLTGHTQQPQAWKVAAEPVKDIELPHPLDLDPFTVGSNMRHLARRCRIEKARPSRRGTTSPSRARRRRACPSPGCGRCEHAGRGRVAGPVRWPRRADEGE